MSNEDDLRAVANRIREIRGEMTQTEFALRLAVHRKTVERWEAADRLPDGASLLELTRVFGVDVTWLLTGLGVGPALSPRETALIDDFRNSSSEGQEAVEKTLKAVSKHACGKRTSTKAA